MCVCKRERERAIIPRIVRPLTGRKLFLLYITIYNVMNSVPVMLYNTKIVILGYCIFKN